MKNILFPTDFSKAANQAFIYALHLADKLEATITTLHVYQQPQIGGDYLTASLKNVFKDFDLMKFKNYKDAIPPLARMAEEKGFSHIRVNHVLEKGDVKDKILEVAKRDEVDLIVMGTTGASGLKEILLGSTTGEILENAPCLVLAVPEESTFDGRLDNIAFTTSFREEEEQALTKVRQLADAFQARIHCINVDLSHTESLNHQMEKLQSKYADQPKLSFRVLDGTDMQETLTSYMNTHRIDILAMVTHKRNFFQELFTYSKTKAMSYHSKTPILSIPTHIL